MNGVNCRIYIVNAFMKLTKQLFDSVAKLAAKSPRLRMNYDLRDSEEEDGQRMLNRGSSERRAKFV